MSLLVAAPWWSSSFDKQASWAWAHASGGRGPKLETLPGPVGGIPLPGDSKVKKSQSRRVPGLEIRTKL